MQVKANSLSFLSSATTTTVSSFLPFFFCPGPCPSLPPPLDQQSDLEWPGLLQFSQTMLVWDLSFYFPFDLLVFFVAVHAANADSAVFAQSSFITWC